MPDQPRLLKILAVSSGGGHWIELLRVLPAFAQGEVVLATVKPEYQRDVPGAALHVIPDATRWNRLGLLKLALRVLWVVLRVRPDIIVTTGAAPGYFSLRFGRWLGARTIWIDSIANVDELSMAGQMAGRFADLWLTQWPHLARPDGPEYAGAVL
ncbi:UDP-N-acetylglucosamine--LPS N-acetylglucosamine transferase [Desulfurivibrio sp. D14AmB]|uniref:UDP-N-acetylglucosamine--LPS N-acetylglucosamine transferase n=1 Tax=Desulfurivibrio sp. D14AmB TaxID=3374370 RepID=UPI00376F23F2